MSLTTAATQLLLRIMIPPYLLLLDRIDTIVVKAPIEGIPINQLVEDPHLFYYHNRHSGPQLRTTTISAALLYF